MKMKSLGMVAGALMLSSCLLSWFSRPFPWLSWLSGPVTLAFFLCGVTDMYIFALWNVLSAFRGKHPRVSGGKTHPPTPLCERPRHRPPEKRLYVPPGYEPVTWRHLHGSNVLSGGDSAACPLCARWHATGQDPPVCPDCGSDRCVRMAGSGSPNVRVSFINRE